MPATGGGEGAEPREDRIQNSKPQTPNPEPQTPNSEPQTPNSELRTPNPEPQTPNSEPQTLQVTIDHRSRDRMAIDLANSPVRASDQQ
jgi:hypothetical protein